MSSFRVGRSAHYVWLPADKLDHEAAAASVAGGFEDGYGARLEGLGDGGGARIDLDVEWYRADSLLRRRAAAGRDLRVTACPVGGDERSGGGCPGVQRCQERGDRGRDLGCPAAGEVVAELVH